MKKYDFIKKVSEVSGYAQKDIAAVLEATETVIGSVMESRDSVKVLGATFATKDVKERTGVSKLGGVDRTWTVPAHTEVTVKASSALKKMFEE